jgi:hypothetical protein
MNEASDHETRWRLLRDVLVFQVKVGMEAVLDITLIPASLAAAGLDLLLGNWRRPRVFHAVLRFGERCEQRINLWGIAVPAGSASRADVDSLIASIQTLAREPGTGAEKVRELRRWAASKLAPPSGPPRDGDTPR